jgi:outer membrane receptor protein involved in Fe transport
LIFWDDIDSVRVIDSTQTDYYKWRKRWNSTQTGVLFQPYSQLKYRIGESLSITLGLHALYFSLTNSISAFEPRLGLKYDMRKRHRLSLGLGRHSQIQPSYMYFYQPGFGANSNSQINRNMGLTKSDHIVLGYEFTITKFFRAKTEVYYQRLFNIPIEKQSSSFSLVNTGAGFSRFFPGELENKGTARNYGWELTLERSLQKGYLFLFTASLFDSKYKGSDGVERNTDFNGKYAMNILGSKEWKTSENSSFTLGLKATTAGGRWYGPADIMKSNNARDLVFIDSLRNTQQFKPYFRLDIKLKYRLNRAKLTHEIGLDLVNVLNTKNVLSLTYAPDLTGDPNKSIRQEYQLGFLPLFYYRLDF